MKWTNEKVSLQLGLLITEDSVTSVVPRIRCLSIAKKDRNIRRCHGIAG